MLIIRTNTDAAVFVNGMLAGETLGEDFVSVPVPSGKTLVSVLPFESCFLPGCCELLTENGATRLIRGCGKLFRWGETCELVCLLPDSVCTYPPILTAETPWGSGAAGIGGRFLVVEGESRRFCSMEFTPEHLDVLSEELLLVRGNGNMAVFNRKLEEIFSSDYISVALEPGHLAVCSHPGGMDCYTMTRRFSRRDCSPMETTLSRELEETPAGLIRCFCETVRLGLEKETMDFLTPELKTQFQFQDICGFLGKFSKLSEIRYRTSVPENALALLYETDDRNAYYICYSFTLKSTTGKLLLDDLQEL